MLPMHPRPLGTAGSDDNSDRSRDVGATGLQALIECARIVASHASPDGDASVEHWAWVHRHARWPVDYRHLRDLLTTEPEDAVRAAVLLCARRMQYGFAWRLLAAFAEAASHDYPTLPALNLHRATSAVMVTGTDRDWRHLCEAAAREPGLYGTDFLTVAVTAPTVPSVVVEAALTVARKQTADGAHVGAYRVVSLLRRLGRISEAWEALATAEEMLVVDPPYQSLFEHLAERLFTERVILTHPAPTLNADADVLATRPPTHPH